ncbi:MAG TPA: putative HNHc nuclease [Sphingobium sp.]
MALPRRIPKAAKRSSRWRSAAHCNFVRSHECVVPGCTSRPIEVAHVRIGSGAGMSQKPDDWQTVSCCRDHHTQQHSIGERSFEKLYSIDLTALADEFASASPRAPQIRMEKASR